MNTNCKNNYSELMLDGNMSQKSGNNPDTIFGKSRWLSQSWWKAILKV